MVTTPFLFVWYVGLVHTVLRLRSVFSDHVRIPSYLYQMRVVVVTRDMWFVVVVSEGGTHAYVEHTSTEKRRLARLALRRPNNRHGYAEPKFYQPVGRLNMMQCNIYLRFGWIEHPAGDAVRPVVRGDRDWHAAAAELGTLYLVAVYHYQTPVLPQVDGGRNVKESK